LLDGIGLIVGIDKFMSEARALTNFSGNAIATVLIGAWTQSMDHKRMHDVLDGDVPFDEQTMVDDDHGPSRTEPVASGERS
jgi:aerobic C4-dicarboxylate transport protein